MFIPTLFPLLTSFYGSSQYVGFIIGCHVMHGQTGTVSVVSSCSLTGDSRCLPFAQTEQKKSETILTKFTAAHLELHMSLFPHASPRLVQFRFACDQS